MKAVNLREQTEDELRNLLEETRRELGEMRMMHRVGDGSRQPIQRRGLRRNIARIETVLTERRAAGDEA